MSMCWMDVWPGHYLPRPFQYHTMQQEKRRNKTKNNQNTWISHKRTRLYGACKLHNAKKNLQEEISPSILVHRVLSHRKFSAQKLSLENPWTPEVLASAVQKPLQSPALASLLSVTTLSLFFGLRTVHPLEKTKTTPLCLLFPVFYRA